MPHVKWSMGGKADEKVWRSLLLYCNVININWINHRELSEMLLKNAQAQTAPRPPADKM